MVYLVTPGGFNRFAMLNVKILNLDRETGK